MRYLSFPILALFLSASPVAAADKPINLDDLFKALRERVQEEAKPLREPKPKAAADVQDAASMRIISWNIQTWGSSVNPKRQDGYRAILDHMFSENRTARVLSVQELAHEAGAKNFESLLPGGADRWNLSFQDSTDSQDNGFYTQKDVGVDCDRLLFSKGGTPVEPDKEKSLHPARVAHMHVGKLDFTIVTLHLTYEDGNADASRRELRAILDWLTEYYKDPKNDPDVILSGDFNLPTRKGKEQSTRGSEGNWHPVEDIIEEYPLFREEKDKQGRRRAKKTQLIALVDERTSRQKGEPANNYDHFIMSGDLWDEEYVLGSAGPMPANFLHGVEKKLEVYISDHYPISAQFRTSGKGNNRRAVRRDGNGACLAP